MYKKLEKKELDQLEESQVQLTKLVNVKGIQAREYFLNKIYYFRHQEDYISKTKFEFFYVNLLIDKKNQDKIGNFIENILGDFQKCAGFINPQDYEGLLLYVYAEILTICSKMLKNTSIGDEPKANLLAEVYYIATSFFLKNGKEDWACTLLIEKADLYQTKLNDLKAAKNCLNKVLQIKYKQCLAQETYPQQLNIIIKTLQKFCELVDSTEEKTLYSNVVDVLNRDTKNTALDKDFIALAEEASAKRKRVLCKQFYYIGHLIRQTEKLENLNTEYNDQIERELFKKLLDVSDIFLAISNDSLDDVQSFIQENVSLEDINSDGFTPLSYAVTQKNPSLPIIKLLITSGARVNFILIGDDNNNIVDAPLYFAVKNKQFEVAEVLLNSHAEVNSPNSENHSLLFIATENKDIKMIELLKIYGAKLKDENEEKLLRSNSLYLNNSSTNFLSNILCPLNNKSNVKLNKIFCIHPLTGEVSAYKEFAEKIKKAPMSRPVWGINAPGIFNMDFQTKTIDAAASMYIQAIKLKQKKGPYILCGWSSGGLIAFEIAYQLMKQREPVILVGLFDTLSPYLLKNMEPGKFAKYLVRVVNSVLNVKPPFSLEIDLNELKKHKNDKQIDVIFTMIEKQLSKNEHDILRTLNIVKMNLHAALTYDPPQDDFTPFVTCFNTTESISEYNCSDLGWKYQTNGRLIVNKINSTHSAMLKDEKVLTDLTNYILDHFNVRGSDLFFQSQTEAPSKSTVVATISYSIKNKKMNEGTLLGVRGLFKTDRQNLGFSESKSKLKFNDVYKI